MRETTSLQPGSRLGPYRIADKLGEGGMGVVFRARDSELGREVALKILPERFTADSERVGRFEREAKLLASLNHPNIAQIYGLETSDDLRAFVMELVDGPTLAERIRSGPLPVEESLTVARQIADALEEAHGKGIVHRDLKPQNVKAPPGQRVKVLDFGLAKPYFGDGSGEEVSDSQPTIDYRDSDRQETRAGAILGTPAYMAPEQARAQPVDKRVDIWAFGVVLYEMLTGTALFAAPSQADTLMAVLGRDIDWSLLPSSTPRAIRRLLRRCIERDPQNRLHDIADARIVIDDVLAGDDDDEREGSAEGTDGTDGTVRPRRGLAAAAVVAIAAAAALGALVTDWLQPSAPEPVRLQRLTFSGHDHQPTASPDGRFVAFVSTREGVSRIWLKQMSGGGEQRLTDGPDVRPRFSPDGNALGFLRESGSGETDLYRTALVGGQPRRLLADVYDFDWSPDGRSVAFVRRQSNEAGAQTSVLGIADVAGSGGEREILEVGGWGLVGPRYRPDGGRIAATVVTSINSSGVFRILEVDPATGASEEIVASDGDGMLSSVLWDTAGRRLLFASAGESVGDLAGTPSRVVLAEPGAPGQTLFWASGLFPLSGFGAFPAVFTRLGAGRIVFDTLELSEELREVDLVSGSIRPLTQALATDRQPAYSPDGRQVVFSSNRTGNLDLWLVDRDSGGLRQLTDDASQDWDPAFSADGRRVLFSSSRGGNLEIWSINADGSDPRQLSRDGVNAENPTMTPDGRWVVYASGNAEHQGLYRMLADGSEVTQITRGNHITSEVSPDGRWAAFISTTGLAARIEFVEIETGRLAAAAIDLGSISREVTVTLGRSRWTRDGAALAFVGVDEQGRSGIFEQSFDPDRDTDDTRRKLTGFFDDTTTESFGVSPDGSKITLAVIRETRSLVLAEGVPID